MKRFSILSLLLFILSSILTPLIISYFSIDVLGQPDNKSYRSDELSFLKTFYLMEKGKGYYQAFKEARENLADSDILTADAFTWRMPGSFYLWSIFAQNGQQILTLYIFLALTSLFCVYQILKRIIPAKLAILGPILLLPYFYDSLRYKTAFLFTEWWGIIFFIIGLTGYLLNIKKAAMLGFVLAITTRELFIIPLTALLIVAWIRKENWQVLLFAVILPSIIYFIHSLNIRSLVGGETNFKFFERFHTYSLTDLQRMVSFSMRGYVMLGLKTHYLVLLLGMLGALGNIIFTKKKEAICIITVIISFLVTLPFISVFDNDYWGIMFVPFIIMSIPILFNFRRR